MEIPFSIEECKLALKQCHDNKAPGISDIPIEGPKYGVSEYSLRMQCDMFNSMLQDGIVPLSMKEIKIIPIYKKGSRDDCDNYRGISLMEHKMKWLERMILNRLGPFAEKYDSGMVLPETQLGFRQDRSAVDAIMINRLLTNNALISMTHIYKCFIDLSKAYDRVDRPLLWELLRRLGIPHSLVRLIENLHTGSRATVVTPGFDTTSKQFPLERGLKQGSVLAPLLFNIFSGAMIAHMKDLLGRSKAGTRIVYNINSSPLDLSDHPDPLHEHHLYDKFYPGNLLMIQELLYADDCVLYAESEAFLQELVSAYNTAAVR